MTKESPAPTTRSAFVAGRLREERVRPAPYQLLESTLALVGGAASLGFCGDVDYPTLHGAWARLALSTQAMLQGVAVDEGRSYGMLDPGALDELVDALERGGLTRAMRSRDKHRRDRESIVYIGADCWCELQLFWELRSGDAPGEPVPTAISWGAAAMGAERDDERSAIEVMSSIADLLTERRISAEGELHIIVKSELDFRIRLASEHAGAPLERTNYTPEVCEAYDRLVADLRSPTPRGRLAILDGPTGTGKTWMLRGLIQACPECMFVLTPPALVGKIASPELVSLLLDHRWNARHAFRAEQRGVTKRDRPLVFVIEDGDACLVPRGSENLMEIQSLLNATDGLLNASFDTRAIVTTNAEHIGADEGPQIDEALTRHGRLSARITVQGHSREEADAILQRLLHDSSAKMPADADASWPGADPAPITLADIYYEAQERGWRSLRVPGGEL